MLTEEVEYCLGVRSWLILRVQVESEMLTRVIEQRLVLAFLGGRDQIPDEALDLVITFVVSQAVNQQSPV